jgi:hypothetical protein
MRADNHEHNGSVIPAADTLERAGTGGFLCTTSCLWPKARGKHLLFHNIHSKRHRKPKSSGLYFRKVKLCLFHHFFFFSFSTGIGTQSLTLVSQVLYHLSHSACPFLYWVFFFFFLR